MKKSKKVFHNARFVKMMRRFLGEEKGAVAMEYIVIALLVAAAIVALVMVFSGNLRNMLGTSNSVMTQTTVEGINNTANDYHIERENLKYNNDTAKAAGDKLGGAFSDTSSGGYCEPLPGNK